MRHPWLAAMAVLAVLVLAGGSYLAYYIPTLGERLRHRVVSAMEERFDADVQLGSLSFSLAPPQVDGDGLVISPKGHEANAPPMIRIRHFRARAGIPTILHLREFVDQVVLDGLEIHVPRRRDNATQAARDKRKDESGPGASQLRFVIRTIVAQNASFEIEPRPGKDPLSFPIQSLTMHSVGPGQAMTFEARLTNAKPPGTIQTSGHFGPWQRDDPRATRLSGDYTFDHADLSVFQGISGFLSSTGRYGGVLERIAVTGTTDVPKFKLQTGGAAVHLTTSFHSLVDGTNGDTLLNPVAAKFGNSKFICQGGVVRHPGEQGKTVDLRASAKDARLEDILTLVMNGKPVMEGNTEFQSKIVIPPGSDQVVKRLNLDGQFHLTSAVFPSPKAEERLRMLSDRASGITKEDEKRGEGPTGAVASNVFGRFQLKDGTIALNPIRFEVPGAKIEMTGRFNMVSSAIDMKGRFEMRAKLSQTQSGVKSILLKPLDRYFEKDGAGFVLPLSVGGTREHPVIGVQAFHKTFSIH